MKSIFIRSSRRWMKNLADDMKWDRTHEKSKQMHEISGKTYKEKIFNFIKSTFLPPIEWFLPYELLLSQKISADIIIEPGSRLIFTKKKYICYCENGLGILSYNMKKNNFFNKKIASFLIKKNNFLGFVFYSEAAKKSAYALFGDMIKEKDLGIIYPYCKIPTLENKIFNKNITLGFCSSLFNLKGGRELVDAIIELNLLGTSINLNLLTRQDDIPEEYLLKIENNPFISITEFNLDNLNYFKHINKWDALIHPTYFDSSALTVIEFLNLNKPVISTNIFAISEYVDSKYLMENKKNIFDSSFLPKKNVFLDSEIIRLSSNKEKYCSFLKEEIKSKIQILLSDSNFHSNIFHPKVKITPNMIIKQWTELLDKYQQDKH
ncbi:hypothetical protein ACIH2S_19045 [Providencia sp. PAZ2]|uniref:hypothetical protein n=1 Tax=Providencia lanzhouensis TaxID=3378099 RepID=UPI003D2D574C